jgi:hypothetical protein
MSYFYYFLIKHICSRGQKDQCNHIQRHKTNKFPATVMHLFCSIMYSMKMVHMKLIHMFFPAKKPLKGCRFWLDEHVSCGGVVVAEAVQGAVQEGICWVVHQRMPASLLTQTVFSGLSSFTQNSL